MALATGRAVERTLRGDHTRSRPVTGNPLAGFGSRAWARADLVTPTAGVPPTDRGVHVSLGTALRVSRSSVPSGVAKRRLRAVRPAARPHKEEREERVERVATPAHGRTPHPRSPYGGAGWPDCVAVASAAHGTRSTTTDADYDKVLPPGRRRPPCRDTKPARGRTSYRRPQTMGSSRLVATEAL